MIEILENSEKITFDNLDGMKHPIKGTARELVFTALEKNMAVYRIFENKDIFVLNDGKKIIWLHESLTSLANPVGINIARNKNSTKRFLKKIGCPFAESKVISTLEELNDAIEEISYPVVIKPLSSGGGKGITTNIKSCDVLTDSFNYAKDFGDKILIEKYASGDYYRITYIADGSFAATRNLPAIISGNGTKTARELIDSENKNNPERKKEGRLKKIRITGKTERFLASYGYTLDSIIPAGEEIPLCFSGFDGGEYIDVTEEVHPYYIGLAGKISRNLGLPIVGIDVVSPNIHESLAQNGGVVIEINGSYPDIQFHSKPTSGKSRNLAPKLIDYLFKNA